MNNETLLHHFYSSFASANAREMVSCYADNVVFEDPAFGILHGEEAKKMWLMLIERSGGNIKITFDEVKADHQKGSVKWKAEYIFIQTGNKVINQIKANFEFNDGKIIRHTDYFDLWKWSRQALGFKGLLLGWTPFMKNKIQQQTKHLLKNYKLK